MNGERSRRPSRCGFTLMELLVVISIIAVLAAMLMPAIQLVRASAQTSVCAGNLRQFGMAFAVYVQDNEAQWPTGLWHQLLQDYINESGEIAANLGVSAKYRLCRCPSAPARTAAGADLNASYSYTGAYYPSWSSGTPNYFGWPLVSNAPVISDPRIVRRAEKCVLSEYWDNSNYSVGQASWGKSQLNNGGVVRVHRAGSNFLLADGRVQFGKLPTFAMYTPTTLSDNLWYPYVNTASVLMK